MSRLSDLNRAALAAKEGYWWINGIALALSAVIARMSWHAYSLADQSDRAFVCIIAQAVAIAAAILGRRALTGQMGLSAVFAGVLAAGCAWWASHGLALAWYGDQERNGEPMVIFMAALEPALFLLAEHVKEGREALRAAHERDARETAEELARIRQREERPPASRPRLVEAVSHSAASAKPASQIGQSVAGVAALSASMAGLMADRPAEAATLQPPPTEQHEPAGRTWPSREAHATELLHQGKSQRKAAEETGLSRYRIGQLAAGLAA